VKTGDGAPVDEGTMTSAGSIETIVATEGDVSQYPADSENPMAPVGGVPSRRGLMSMLRHQRCDLNHMC
jgi:hypothetical protein